MLVLTRNDNESILIDDGRIKLTLIKGTNGRAKLGFECDPKISILREEIADKPKQEVSNNG